MLKYAPWLVLAIAVLLIVWTAQRTMPVPSTMAEGFDDKEDLKLEDIRNLDKLFDILNLTEEDEVHPKKLSEFEEYFEMRGLERS